MSVRRQLLIFAQEGWFGAAVGRNCPGRPADRQLVPTQSLCHVPVNRYTGMGLLPNGGREHRDYRVFSA
jgi:hypothetical protein